MKGASSPVSGTHKQSMVQPVMKVVPHAVQTGSDEKIAPIGGSGLYLQ